MPSIRRIDHLAVVVADLDEALTFWCDALGLQVAEIAAVPQERASIAFLPVANGEIELVQPTESLQNSQPWRRCATNTVSVNRSCIHRTTWAFLQTSCT